MVYKRNVITKTNTTTDITKMAWGQLYKAVGYVYEIEGPQGKPAQQEPFLTSIRECKEYINDEIFMADKTAQCLDCDW